jgi:prepilin peptidase CpaA
MQPILIIFPTCLVIAAVSDLLTMTIPNWLCGILSISFLAVAMYLNLPLDVLVANIVWTVVSLFLFLAFFHFGWLGGGDAKLILAVSLWLDGDSLLRFYYLMAIWGGILAVFLLLLRSTGLPDFLMRRTFIARLAEPATGIPYGIAIAIGGMLAFPQSTLWELSERM